MIADLLSPNRWNWLIANVKNFNLNVTEVLVSDFKNAFSQNFQFHRRDPNEEIIAFFAALREESNTVRSRLVEADANSIVGTQRVTNFYGPDDLTSGSSSSDESYNFEIESSSSDSSGILEPLSRTENDRLAELERLDIARRIHRDRQRLVQHLGGSGPSTALESPQLTESSSSAEEAEDRRQKNSKRRKRS